MVLLNNNGIEAKVSNKEYKKVRNLVLLANLMLILALIPFILSFNFNLFNPIVSVMVYAIFTVIAVCLKFYSQFVKKSILLKSLMN